MTRDSAHSWRTHRGRNKRQEERCAQSILIGPRLVHFSQQRASERPEALFRGCFLGNFYEGDEDASPILSATQKCEVSLKQTPGSSRYTTISNTAIDNNNIKKNGIARRHYHAILGSRIRNTVARVYEISRSRILIPKLTFGQGSPKTSSRLVPFHMTTLDE